MAWFNRPYSSGGSEIKRTSLYTLSEGADLDAIRKRQQEEKHRAGTMEEPKITLPSSLPEGAPVLGLRVDVDTHDGMRDGVPRLLDTLRETGARGTFYLAFGPDNSGRAILNVVTRPGFLKKMLRTGAPKVYGWRTMLSGTLLPARKVALAFPHIARRIKEEGHEVGVHAWNHRSWQDRLLRFSSERVVLELERGAEAFAQIFNEKPRTFAAPAWFCRNESLEHQELMNLDYASDCRGSDPFLPVIDVRPMRTPQVPTTMPTLDEALGEADRDASSFFAKRLAEIEVGQWHSLTVHAELEGGPYLNEFADFLREAKGRGIAIATLRDLLGARLATGRPLPHCTMSYGEVEGRHGIVSLQMLEV
jgi:peptidoglycan/xylan/chitin deacetylase (PgdA/CDA1 family)